MKKIVSLYAAGLLSFTSFAQMRITEFMYDGNNAEFVEFTNTGTVSIDMTGWSFDDNSRVAGSESLSNYGIVQPGESVIFAESSASTFRTAWGLCNGLKIIGGNTDNLGRSDEINLYDASSNLIDRLTFNDQGTGSVKAPRTQNKSAWVPLSALGANTASSWTLSAVNDTEASFTSSGGDIGSPGKSTRATVVYNPCALPNGAPTIVPDVTATSNFLDGGVTIAPISPYGISGVISDPTDPAATLGLNFTIGDPDTPVGSLTVTASSSNTQVVPLANVTITGSATSRTIKIVPLTVGYSNITITVSDGTSNTSYILNYAASAAAAIPANTLWHTGMSDGSAAIALDDNYYIAGDDELDILNVYSRSASGLPLKSYDYSANLNLPDPSKPEVDVEAATRSTATTNIVYWLGSMSNGKAPSFDDKPNRNRLFATTVSGTGSTTAFTFSGYYGNLKTNLLAWGDVNSYSFTASAAVGVDSKAINGFAAEGLVFGPDNTTLYIGLRAPLVPIANRTNAVIAPIVNFESWFNGGSPTGNPTFGSPIELNLGGRGIRDLIRLSNGTYIVIAGNYASTPVTGAIYKWSGYATDAPVLVSSPGSNALAMEGAMQVNVSGQLSVSKLQVICDLGDEVLYNDGSAAKDLGDLNLRKFRSDNLSGLDLCQVTASITAAGSKTLCQGQSVKLTANAGMASYLWSNGATTQTISVSAAGSYSVKVTDGNGCIGSSGLITISVNPLPTATITANGTTSLCAGSSVGIAATPGISNYLWSNGATTQSINVTTSGNYFVTVADGSGCSATTSSIAVQVHNNVSNSGIIGPDQSHCGSFKPALLNSIAPAAADSGETVYYQWLKSPVDVINTYGNPYWQDIVGANSPGYQPDSISQSTFYVRCSRTQFCTFVGYTTESAILDIYINPLPTATISVSGGTLLCAGDSVTLSTNAGMSAYLWANGASTQTISAFASGNYSVTVTDTSGCSATSAPITVSVNPVSASSITVTACMNYVWNGVTYTVSGVYTYSAQNSSGCDSTAVLNLIVNNSVNSITTETACNSYVWNGTTYTATGVYTYTSQNVTGCDSLATLNLTLFTGPVASIIPAGTATFCPGGFITLSTTDSINSRLWSDGETAPSINVSQESNITLQITDINGCTATDTVMVKNGLPQDFTGDAKVDVDDFLLFVPKFGASCTCAQDLNHDGRVDIDDFMLFSPGFGYSCR